MSATKKEEGNEWEHIPMGPCMCMHVDVGECIVAVCALAQIFVLHILFSFHILSRLSAMFSN